MIHNTYVDRGGVRKIKERIIRNSARAIITKDNKVLLIKNTEAGKDYYVLPGGGQEVGENLAQTVVRECEEEANVEIAIGDIICVIECIEGEPFHRIDIIFRATYLGESKKKNENLDTEQIGVEWIPISQIADINFYPEKVKKFILGSTECERIYGGNENWVGFTK